MSASHNPIADNGIKFFGADGFKLSDEREAGPIEAALDRDDLPRPTGTEVGVAGVAQNLAEHYYEELYAGAGGGARWAARRRRRGLRRGLRDRAVRTAQARRAVT